MNRTDTEAAISGYLPRRARRHLPAIMAAVDAHAAAEREDLDRVAAEGARRQKLVAEEFAVVKAERDEVKHHYELLRNDFEHRGEAIRDLSAGLDRMTAERDEALAAVKAITAGRDDALQSYRAENDRLQRERDEWEKRCEEARAHLDEAGTQAVVQHGRIRELTAERDRLREQLADRTDLLTNRENLIGYRIGHQIHHPADVTIVYRDMAIEGEHEPELVTLAPEPAPGGDAEPAQNRARTATGARTARGTGTRKARGGTDAPRDADGGAE